MSFYAVQKCADEIKMSHQKRFLIFEIRYSFQNLTVTLLRNEFLRVKFQRKRKLKAYKLQLYALRFIEIYFHFFQKAPTS